MKMTNIIITHAQELLTLRGASDRPKLREELADLGIIEDGALAIRNGKIIAMGSSEEIEQLRGTRTQLIDASGKVVMPGFVDCHTHLVFAGWREDEFVQKIRGKTYLEILREGGGILSTVRATRRASPDRLFQQA
jgi:imidazolonepropionase